MISLSVQPVIMVLIRHAGTGQEKCLPGLQKKTAAKKSVLSYRRTTLTRESFYQQLIRRIPFPQKTAVFFLSDFYAIEAISYLATRGVCIPADIGIAGFDDITYARLTVPRLTTIHQDMEKKAELAVSELLKAIENPAAYTGKESLLDVILIARDSI